MHNVQILFLDFLTIYVRQYKVGADLDGIPLIANDMITRRDDREVRQPFGNLSPSRPLKCANATFRTHDKVKSLA